MLTDSRARSGYDLANRPPGQHPDSLRNVTEVSRMAAHAKPVSSTTTFGAAIDLMADMRRVFVFAAIFCFALAFTAISLGGIGTRTIQLEWSPTDAPAAPAVSSTVPSTPAD